MAAITRWSTGLRCVQRCSGPHPFLLNPSSHSAPLINYVSRNESSDRLLASLDEIEHFKW